MSTKLREAAEAAHGLLNKLATIGDTGVRALLGPTIEKLRDALADASAERVSEIDADLAKLDSLKADLLSLQEKGPALPLRAMLASSAMSGLLSGLPMVSRTEAEAEKFALRCVPVALAATDALLAALAAEPTS